MGLAGVSGLVKAEAAKSGAIKGIHTIRNIHLGPQEVVVYARM
jgi:hypothetical protein